MAAKHELHALTDNQLAALQEHVASEVARRTAAALESSVRRFREWSSKLTKETVNLFAAEHCRTSCSDENRNNGLRSTGPDRRSPRCVRCALLDIIEEGGYFQDYPLSLTIQIN